MFKKTTLYIVRTDKKSNLQDSAPCQDCLCLISNLKIKRVVFSCSDNTFTSCPPCEITTTHMSAGNRQIMKSIEENKENNNKNKNKNKIKNKK